MKDYEACKQLCWEAEDSLKCKQELYREYVKIIENRQKAPKLPNLTLEMYKAGMSVLVYFIQQFSLHAGLDKIQCKMDVNNNSTWIRIPTRTLCVGELLT